MLFNMVFGLRQAAECFDAVARLGLLPLLTNGTETSAAAPSGCYVTAAKGGYVVGRGHVSQLTNLDPWHSKRVIDIADL
jgi:hypothetical protein